MIDWTSIIISICAILLTGVLIPMIRGKLTLEQQETLEYWANIAVRWAKQWMQTATGEEKKEEVFRFVSEKAAALGLRVDEEDIDKAIEAVYEMVKKEM